MLRAVVQLSDLIALLSGVTVHYIGKRFPRFKEDVSSSTVAEVAPDEMQRGWRAGFYHIGKTPLEFEELIRLLPQ